MVNPYELSSRQNQRKQVSLSSSNALKKFEKLEAKHTGKPIKSNSKKSSRINSSGDENSIFRNDVDDDDEDEDSVFKNLKKNKFIKKKPLAEKQSESDKSDLSDTDLEISIADRSSTPNRKSSIQRSSSRLRSEASSATEFYPSNLPKRSPSRVKFLKQDSISDQDESQVEDLIGKHLVLSIDDLEPAEKKFTIKSKSKSPINSGRKTASAASIIEEDELSTATISTQSPSLMNANVILDIQQLDKSDTSVSKSSKKSSKKKNKEKKKKRLKTPNSFIETETDYRTADSSIVTEIGEKKSLKSDSEFDFVSQSNRRSSYKSYYDDFETDQDLTLVSRSEKPKKKHLSFAENKKVSNSEVQVDPNDLLRHSDLIRSVNTYNPSSLLLASVSFLNEGTNLKDLNQLTGFNLINQTFNDLIRMNVNFMKNFLATQKSLYEQQIASIHPK